MRAHTTKIVVLALAATALAMVPVASGGSGATERVSVDGTGGEANGDSGFPAISADARYVAFDSVASNLVSGDTNGAKDIFVHDRQSRTTEQVSVDSAGGPSNGSSFQPSISADGRYVAFTSAASSLLLPFSGDTNGAWDVFVHDRQSGTTERVSVDSAGGQANGPSYLPAISADGRYVAFGSLASNLVFGDSNGTEDVFVHDRQTGTTERVSVNSAGMQAGNFGAPPVFAYPAISADGRYVAFFSAAQDLVPGDKNGIWDVFVHDRQTGTTERVSVDGAGGEANGPSELPGISADGRYVAFLSSATNLVPSDTNGAEDLFVHDRQTGATERVNVSGAGDEANGRSGTRPALSADGRYIAFDSLATNLVPGDTNNAYDAFVRDRQSGTTERVSLDSAGSETNSGSLWPVISTDGRYVAFASLASTLVPDDANMAEDVFVRDRAALADTTAPAIVLATPPQNVAYTLGKTVLADYACADETGGSGLASCMGTASNGSPIDTGTIGSKTFTVSASDKAGNSSSVTHAYSVMYDFGAGFLAPVDNPPTLNVLKAGAAVPVKFSLQGNQGPAIFASGYPQSQPMTCDTSAPLDGVEQTVTAGESSLTYDPTTGLYTYVWKTDKAWGSSCRKLDLKLMDGTDHVAYFKFGR